MRERARYPLVGQEGAARPDPVQAAWLYAQMVRWGQTAMRPDALKTAMAVFRPDLNDAALGQPGKRGRVHPMRLGPLLVLPLIPTIIAGHLVSVQDRALEALIDADEAKLGICHDSLIAGHIAFRTTRCEAYRSQVTTAPEFQPTVSIEPIIFLTTARAGMQLVCCSAAKRQRCRPANVQDGFPQQRRWSNPISLTPPIVAAGASSRP